MIFFPRQSWNAGFLRIALAIGVTAVATPSLAQNGWSASCADNGRCTALLVLTDSSNGENVVTFGVQMGQGGDEPIFVGFLPLGVSLPAGLRIVFGTEVQDFPYEVCFPDGCRASGPLSAEQLALWLEAEAVQIQFFVLGSDKPAAVDAPLAGLKEALANVLPAPN